MARTFLLRHAITAILAEQSRLAHEMLMRGRHRIGAAVPSRLTNLYRNLCFVLELLLVLAKV